MRSVNLDPTLLEIVHDILARWNVPEQVRLASARAREVFALEFELSDSSLGPQRASELNQMLAQARACWQASQEEAARALAGAASESIPIEIVWRVERLVSEARDDEALGMLPSTKRDAALAELDALAARVVNVWLTDYHPASLAHALAISQANELAVPSPPPRRDTRLGWAPIDTAELQARVQHAMASGEAVQTRTRHRAKLEEFHSASLALQRARESDLSRPEIRALEQTLENRHDDVLGEVEALAWNAQTALSTFPPLGVYSALTAAAGVLRASFELTELGFDATGHLRDAPSPAPRAILLASLVELRRSVENAFPGLRGALALDNRSDSANVDRSAGAYRARVATGDTARFDGVDTGREVRTAIERVAVRPIVGRALGHAVLLGQTTQQIAITQVGLVNHLAFWSSSPEEVEKGQLERRRAWHDERLRAAIEHLLERTNAAAQEGFLYVLRDLVTRMHIAVEAFEAPGSVSALLHASRDRNLPPGSALVQRLDRLFSDEFLLARPTRGDLPTKPEALAAIRQIHRLLAQQLGLTLDRNALIQQIVHHLTSPLDVARDELVRAVAESLRGTDFVHVEDRFRTAQAAYARADAHLAIANFTISRIDRLNVFTETPAERARKEALTNLKQLPGRIREDGDRMHQLLDAALAHHPHANVFYRLDAVHRWVSSVRCQTVGSRETSTTYELLHKKPALDAVRDWTSLAIAVFGPLSTNAALIAWFVAGELQDGMG